MQTVREAIEQYSSLGFDTLPLQPGTKEARLKDWPRITPAQMWQAAPQDANIGIRAGGPARVAIIDCDEKERPGTFWNFQDWLAGLGYQPGDYPLIQTASGNGRHIYVTFAGELAGNFGIVSESFGAGEFRYGPGAYVVAPPSMVGGNAYLLLTGDYHSLPALGKADVLQFLNKQPVDNKQAEQSFRAYPRIPRRTLALLNGNGVDRYPSRSHAEQAIITGLVNAGFDFDGVLRQFTKYPCTGRFQAEPSKSALDYLRRSYDSALEYATSNESKGRQAAQAFLEWAKSQPWPGKTGQYDKLVFIAHATIAYKAGRLEYNASARQLADTAGISPEAAMNATRRLCEAGLLEQVREWVADCANTYRLESQSLTLPS
jgi:hypothetical protein